MDKCVSMKRDLIKAWLTYLQIELGRSDTTCMRYRRELEKLKVWARVKRKSLTGLSRYDCSDWIKEKSKRGLQPATINIAIAACKHFFKFLMSERYITRDPMTQINYLPRPEVLPKYLNEDEVDRLLSVPDVTTYQGMLDRTLIEVLYASGMRSFEVVNLEIKDVNLARGLLQCTGKGKRPRIVRIGREARIWLHRYFHLRNKLDRNNRPFVFLRADGRQLSTTYIWYRIKISAKGAGLNGITTHSLRHTFATHLLEHGASIRHIQILLGHESPETTQVYTHVTIKHLRSIYDRYHPRACAEVNVGCEVEYLETSIGLTHVLQHEVPWTEAYNNRAKNLLKTANS